VESGGGVGRDRMSERHLARTARSIAAFVAVAVVGGVVASGLLVPVTAAVGGAVRAETSLLSGLPAALSAASLDQTSVILAADGSPIASFYTENRTQIPLSQMSPLVQDALLAVEDDRFFDHGPVDAKGLLRAAVNNAAGGSTQGASTLTQQYVKNMLLEQAVTAHDAAGVAAATAPTSARKLKELRLAITVERQLTKQQILERYLNLVYFDQQTYGVQAAALRYFGVPAARLTLPQAALLAGMVHDPSADDPVLHPQAARNRRNVVLAKMLAQKKITQAQYGTAVATPVTVTGSPLPNGCDPAATEGFFCQYVVQSILTGPSYSALGATPAARRDALMNGGLVVRTTLDPRTQSGAVRAVDAAVPPTDRSGLATTAVTVEPGTGAVLAMAEDRTFSTTAGPGRTTVNYATDSPLGGAQGFQTGSSFKPFTLAAWLAAGNGLGDTVDATRRAFPFSDFRACGKSLAGSQPYTPGNSEGTESGPMSVVSATANSVNVAYVDMESQLDLCDITSLAQKLGVHLAAPQDDCGTGPATTLPTCLPSLTLGVADISPLTMAAAYAGFATGGIYCAPSPVRSIARIFSSDAPAQTVATYAPHCDRALSGDVAAGVNAALTHVLTDGTAAAVGPLDPWPSAGKTGTTDGPYDTWFVGYTAQRATAVWVGDPGHSSGGTATRRRLTDIEVNGRYYPIVFGASIAAPVWKAVMDTAMHGLPARPLPLHDVDTSAQARGTTGPSPTGPPSAGPTAGRTAGPTASPTGRPPAGPTSRTPSPATTSGPVVGTTAPPPTRTTTPASPTSRRPSATPSPTGAG